MIHDIVLRWVVIGLFALTALEYGAAVVTKPRPWTSAVNHALHFVMAVAMVVMAWPWSAKIPTTGPAVFFLLAAVTFAAMAIFAIRTTTRRELYLYHGLMMLATAWMYAIMDSHLMPARSSTRPDMSNMRCRAWTCRAMNMPASQRIACVVSAQWAGSVQSASLSQRCFGLTGMSLIAVVRWHHADRWVTWVRR